MHTNIIFKKHVSWFGTHHGEQDNITHQHLTVASNQLL